MTLLWKLLKTTLASWSAKPEPPRRRRVPARAPKTIRIRPDEDDARYVGVCETGESFFLTNPFVPASAADAGCEYVALYRFNAAGVLLDAQIQSLGPRAGLRPGQLQAALEQSLQSLGKFRKKTIRVAPFSVSRFGIDFGLIAVPPESFHDPDDHWWVEAQPGNYMAFYPPWSGDYDT